MNGNEKIPPRLEQYEHFFAHILLMHLESASNQIQALYTQYEQDRLLPDHEFQAKALQVAQNAETILEELFKDISKELQDTNITVPEKIVSVVTKIETIYQNLRSLSDNAIAADGLTGTLFVDLLVDGRKMTTQQFRYGNALIFLIQDLHDILQGEEML